MDEKKPLVTKTREDIQAKLDKKLGPEYISKRVGFGSSRVAYIEGWRAINLANQIFGYNGWSTEVKNVIIDFLDERQGKYCIGCTAIVRVTLDNGTYREDIGYGTVENERRKAAAFERAKKSAVTDALKRSLRSFGNALGNCLYDKDFLSKIDKVKFDPPDFDEGNLFRPSDEISESSRSNTLDVSEVRNMSKRRQLTKVGNPVSEPILEPNESEQRRPQQRHLEQGRFQSTSKNLDTMEAEVEPKQEQDELLDDSLMFSDDFQDDDLINMGKQNVPPQNTTIPSEDQDQNSNPVTFVTAKAAPSLQNKRPVTEENVFDPKYQAQSIRHTIDQSTSKHIPATVLKEKGIDDSRDSIYQKFAPKGKQIEFITPGNPPEEQFDNSGSVPSSSTVASSRFAPPNTVVHPNSPLAVTAQQKPARREVGRPKVNPLNLRKANP